LGQNMFEQQKLEEIKNLFSASRYMDQFCGQMKSKTDVYIWTRDINLKVINVVIALKS
jgi:hypothetical protein